MTNIYILRRSEGQYEDYHETNIVASYHIEDIEVLRDKAYKELEKAFELEYPDFSDNCIDFTKVSNQDFGSISDYHDKEQEAYDDFDIKFKEFLTVDKTLSRDIWSAYNDYDYSITIVPMIEYDD
jgi:hypothetical protein